MLESMMKAIHTLRGSSAATTDQVAPTIKYVLVQDYECDEENKAITFATAEERERYAARLATGSLARVDEEDVVQRLLFEDTVEIWRKSKSSTEVPQIPDIFEATDGAEIILRVETSGNGIGEFSGFAKKEYAAFFERCKERPPMHPKRAWLVLRRTAYERMTMLVAS